jgi:hypothetical protein
LPKVGAAANVIRELANMLNWNPIKAQAIQVAESLGHELSAFDSKRTGFGNIVRMASCEICLGCCWMSYQVGGGFKAGGRLLKYRCGTEEAAGSL